MSALGFLSGVRELVSLPVKLTCEGEDGTGLPCSRWPIEQHMWELYDQLVASSDSMSLHS